MALGLLVRHPSLFAGATLIGVHPGLEEEEGRSARALADERWATLAEKGGVEAFLAAWEAEPLFASQRRLAPEVLAAQRTWRRSLSAAGLALSLRRVGLAGMPSYWGHLPALLVPVHLLAGEADEKYRRLAERARAALPHAHVSIIPGCGHNAILESPAAIAAALDEVSRASPSPQERLR